MGGSKVEQNSTVGSSQAAAVSTPVWKAHAAVQSRREIGARRMSLGKLGGKLASGSTRLVSRCAVGDGTAAVGVMGAMALGNEAKLINGGDS